MKIIIWHEKNGALLGFHLCALLADRRSLRAWSQKPQAKGRGPPAGGRNLKEACLRHGKPYANRRSHGAGSLMLAPLCALSEKPQRL
jgi:hypothetical protein